MAIALEGDFQGGSMGEVSGQKMAAALDLACADSEKGTPTSAVLLLETGGVRLQEANLGLAVIAELLVPSYNSEDMRRSFAWSREWSGCFGSMSLAAGLAGYLVMTREARLGLNGPEVIQQESGIDEFDPSDRAIVWAINGGEQRYAMGLADALVEDDTPQIVEAIRHFVTKGLPPVHRSSEVKLYSERIKALDPSRQWDPKVFRTLWTANRNSEQNG